MGIEVLFKAIFKLLMARKIITADEYDLISGTFNSACEPEDTVRVIDAILDGK